MLHDESWKIRQKNETYFTVCHVTRALVEKLFFVATATIAEPISQFGEDLVEFARVRLVSRPSLSPVSKCFSVAR